jgi:hypothetical protein
MMMSDPLTTDSDGLSEFIGTRDALIVLREPQLGKSGTQTRAQLRSLPFLTEFGLNRVIHPQIFDNGLRLTAYDHVASEDIRSEGVNELEFPLVHYVSQSMLTGELQDESRTFDEQDVIRRLLRARPKRVPYIIVTDTSKPMMPRHTKKPGKSFIDEFECTVADYKGLLQRYLQNQTDSSLALSATQNLYFHRLSAYNEAAGLPGRSIPDLFDYPKLPADSPAWEPLYYFITEDADKILDEYSERIRAALRSWTERGPTQVVANQMLDMLERVEFEEDRLDSYRRRNEEMK